MGGRAGPGKISLSLFFVCICMHVCIGLITRECLIPCPALTLNPTEPSHCSHAPPHASSAGRCTGAMRS